MKPQEHDDPRDLSWATFQYGRYAVLVRLARIGGVLEIASVEVRGFDQADDETMIPVRGVRLPVTEMLKQARKQLGTSERPPSGVWFGKAAPAQARARRGRPRDYDYQEVAAVYVDAATAGQDPTRAVAKRYDLDRKTAAKLIGRLIKNEVLEPEGGWSTAILVPTVSGVGNVPTPTIRVDPPTGSKRKGRKQE